MKLKHLSPIALLLLAPGAYAQVYKCVEASGRVGYSDRPCAKDALTLAVKTRSTSVCASQLRREDPNNIATKTYSLPAQRIELKCEIAHTKSNIVAYRQMMITVSSANMRNTMGATTLGRAAMADVYFPTQAYMSEEIEHLKLLEAQIQ